MVRIVPADPPAVRDLIARTWLGQESADSRIGDVILHPHQAAAVGRIRGIIREFGGALLCDAVGLGKTYVSLAIAREFENACVVAPASLRDMWRAASRATRVQIRFLSAESLSTRDVIDCAHDIIVVDEAHRFRNRATARYSRLVTMTRDAPVLLLSATPIHNRRDDLTALLELFLGSSACSLPESEIARLVVRRDVLDVSDGPPIPSVQTPVRIEIGDDGDRLRAILALPPPLPPTGGSLAPALTTITLLRLWASSDAALSAGLRSRLARATAMRASLESGKLPTEAELRSWVYADGAVQLGFADMLASTKLTNDDEMLKTLGAHESAIRALYERGKGDSRLDAARIASLLEIRARRPAAKIVAFTQFAETAAAFYRGIKATGRVGMLTAAGGRIASGRISRRETLERFAPVANEVLPPPQSSAIDFLLTTDVLSEGVNLQDASVIVHLDLPWTAAALEQRVGRLARLGSKHREVSVYALDPPASAEELIRAEGIIRAKSGIAADAMGNSRIPSLFPSAHVASPSAVEEREHIRRILATWVSEKIGSVAGPRPTCACGAAELAGFVALVSVDGCPELIADIGEGVSHDPHVVRRALSSVGNPSSACSLHQIEAAKAQIDAWAEAETARKDAGCASEAPSFQRRALFARLSVISGRIPRHLQERSANRIATLRRRLAARLSAGIERDLEELLEYETSDERWIERVESILPERERSPSGPGTRNVYALLIFRPPPHRSG